MVMLKILLENEFYSETGISKLYEKDFRNDIKDFNLLKKRINTIKPEIIFHLAAQSSVIESFKDSSSYVKCCWNS